MLTVGEAFSARGLLGQRRLVGTLTSLKSSLWTFHIYTQGERTVLKKKKLAMFFTQLQHLSTFHWIISKIRKDLWVRNNIS